MKFVLTVSPRGVTRLPEGLLRDLKIEHEGEQIAEPAGDRVLLHRAESLPVEMYSAERIAEFDRSEQELAELLAATRES